MANIWFIPNFYTHRVCFYKRGISFHLISAADEGDDDGDDGGDDLCGGACPPSCSPRVFVDFTVGSETGTSL